MIPTLPFPRREGRYIDLAYALTLELNRVVGMFPRSQRPGLGRRIEEAAFDLLAALVAWCHTQMGIGETPAEL